MNVDESYIDGQSVTMPDLQKQVIDDKYGLPMSDADVKHNFTFCVLLDAFWGMGWTDFQMILQPLLVYLGATNTQMGYVQGMTIFMMPGLILSPFITRRFRTKKKYLFGVNIPYMAMIGLTGLMLISSGRLHLTVPNMLNGVIIFMISHNIFSGFVGLPFQEYIAGCIPSQYRGRFTGVSYTSASILSLGTTALGMYILKAVAKPLSFGYLCLITWALCQGGYLFAMFARERQTPVEKSPKPWSRSMFKALIDDKPFCRYLTWITIYDALIGQVFFFITAYAFKDLKVAAIYTGVFTYINMGVRTVLNTHIGIWNDKFGPKKVIPYYLLIGCLSLIPVVVLKNLWGVFVSLALSQVAIAGISTAAIFMTYGLPKPENRAGHFTFKSIQQYTCQFIGAVSIGFMLDKLGYERVFWFMTVALLVMVPITKRLLSTLPDTIEQYS